MNLYTSTVLIAAVFSNTMGFAAEGFDPVDASSELFKKASDVTAMVVVEANQDTGFSAGSGIVAAQDAEWAYLFTNFHVAREICSKSNAPCSGELRFGYRWNEVTKEFETQTGSQRIVKEFLLQRWDEKRDFAVLKFRHLGQKFRLFEISESIMNYQEEQEFVAFGFPITSLRTSVKDRVQLSVSKGLVVKLATNASVGNGTRGNFYLHDIDILPGMSGGPIFSSAGELVGIQQGFVPKNEVDGYLYSNLMFGVGVPLSHRFSDESIHPLELQNTVVVSKQMVDNPHLLSEVIPQSYFDQLDIESGRYPLGSRLTGRSNTDSFSIGRQIKKTKSIDMALMSALEGILNFDTINKMAIDSSVEVGSVLAPRVSDVVLKFDEQAKTSNCFGAALYFNGDLEWPVFVSEKSFKSWLKQRYSPKEVGDLVKPRDLIVFLDLDNGEILHVMAYAFNGFSFTKANYEKSAPFVLESLHETLRRFSAEDPYFGHEQFGGKIGIKVFKSNP